MNRIPAANRDLARLIDTHLFVICPNDSGSSFLASALETSRAVWRLPREGHQMHGFAGPLPWRSQGAERRIPGLLWAAEQRWIERFADPANHDWPLTRKAWYFHSYAADAAASVFVTKSPPDLLRVEQLVRHFRNARFLFMVRNPYAVCEGICRRYRTHFRAYLRQLEERGESPLAASANHVVNCLAWQRRNIERWGDRGVFFTYESMCADPDGTAQAIRALVPQLEDLNLRQRLVVKDYDEMLVDMNPRHLARLDADEIEALSHVFRQHQDVLAYFDYDIIE